MSIATRINTWLSDIHMNETFDRSYTHMLAYGFNWATSPSRLMTDREQLACRRFARFCWDRLQGQYGWHEQEDGRIWV